MIDSSNKSSIVSASGGIFSNSTISGGNDADTIRNYGNEVLINGGAGNDLIGLLLNASNVTISGDGGDDIITLSSSNKNNVLNYANGDGNDTIIGFNKNSTLNIVDGEITNSSVNGNDVILTVGTGKITIKDAKDIPIAIADSNGKVLTMLSGVNVINNDKNNTEVTLTGSDYNDSIVNYADYVTIDSGAGNDFIQNYGSFVSINAGSGNNTITIKQVVETIQSTLSLGVPQFTAVQVMI